ncbi:hypothetical protein [uncultured Psychroserpens sp.]|uniref:hypothetical protein n=1 Tax=uncultured Psychroserpens sp. TaxID=255436 RepID=UPI002609307F|nr:hypothetical protein [uncultured Psychroserpens sp.]
MDTPIIIYLLLQEPDSYHMDVEMSSGMKFMAAWSILYIILIIAFIIGIILLYFRVMKYFKLKNQLMQRELNNK